jgi:murein DD-endopeptidase MepM/ murein hydrolase activator NlpD
MARLPFPENTITGTFGSMSDYRRKHGLQPHSGVDFAPKGSNKGKTAIPAIGNGTVRLIQFSQVLGWVLVHTIWDIKKKKAAYVGYSHLSCKAHGVNCKGGHDASLALDLKVGQRVTEGQTIGIMGNTGSASSGVHLHATASKQLKGVFGPTSVKADIKKLILANQGVAPKPKAAAPAPAPKVEAPKPVAPVPAKPVNQVPEKPVTPPAPKTVFHKVQPGETLTRIATQYGTTVDKLVADNSIKNASLIQVGQMIRIDK